MVDGYKRKMLNLRGQTIARTETLNALRAGQHDGFKSMVETGVVRDDEMTREWLPTSDNRTREDHAEMAGVSVIGMDTPFTLPDGSNNKLLCSVDTYRARGTIDGDTSRLSR